MSSFRKELSLSSLKKTSEKELKKPQKAELSGPRKSKDFRGFGKKKKARDLGEKILKETSERKTNNFGEKRKIKTTIKMLNEKLLKKDFKKLKC